jgi:bifunctional NMN adenylyltransferase/nudix hydrolase
VDPLTAAERKAMIGYAIDASDWNYSVEPTFVPIRDFLYSENDWIVQVQRAVKETLELPMHSLKMSDCEITIYGAEKSEEKAYLRQFPQWKLHIQESDTVTDLGPGILRDLFEGSDIAEWYPEDFNQYSLTLHDTTRKYLEAWLATARGQRLKAEYEYVVEYKKRTQTSKYAIQFNTVDSVAYYKGNILLVKRRSQPGRGLWALPGGFLESDETRFDGAVRELQEETRLRVKPEWLVARQGFDAPNRSIRGRTITEAFLWKIPDTRRVPQIKAGSDASKAQWFPLSQVLEEMKDQLFEDHLDIIETLTKRL